MNRSKVQRRRSRGFTLIEIVAALVLFALAMGILMQMLGNSMRAARQAEQYSRAALNAQSLLDGIGQGETLREGATNGRLADGLVWELKITKEDPRAVLAQAGAAPRVPSSTPGNAPPAATPPGVQPPSVGGVVEDVPVDLYRLDLVLRWEDGRLRRQAQFSTLRAVQPGGT